MCNDHDACQNVGRYFHGACTQESGGLWACAVVLEFWCPKAKQFGTSHGN